MRSIAYGVAALGLVGMSAGCATFKSEAMKALKANPKTRSFANKAEYYASIAEKLKKFHDSGELNESDVLDVLKKSGVIKGAPAPAPKGGRKAPSVAQVPAPVQNYGGSYRWPLDAGVVSSEFGGRWGKRHEGIDIAADQGEPVKSAADGVVLYSDSTMRGYGNAVVVRHDARTTTLYSHNKGNLVRVGDKVKQGQVLALLGSTGKSTGPHVHFELREGETPVDPRARLAKASF